MFGLTDPWIILAYLSAIGSVAACVIYGVLNWNKGGATPEDLAEDVAWGREEEEIDKEFE